MTDIPDRLSARLDKIDVKLDNLSEAVSLLARIEERISHQTENMSQVHKSIADHEKRIRALEFQGNVSGVVIGRIERFGWIIITAAIGIIGFYFKG